MHAIWSVTGGEFISFESVSYLESLLFPRSSVARLWDGAVDSKWWLPNVEGHKALLKASGFEVLDSDAMFIQPYGPGQPPWRQRRPPGIGYTLGWLAYGWRGIPSAVCRTRPVGKS